LGAAVVLLIFLIRRRLGWVKSTARDTGALGIALAIMAIAIFLGGVLFALRLMPGPAFTVGAAATSVAILAVRRRKDGRRLIPRLPFPYRPDPLVLLGVATGAAGLAIAIQAAWITDVADVNAILRAIT
jgi:ABC-type Fe3+-siderophore transport system permease subunit